MKKLLTILIIGLLFANCEHNEVITPEPEQSYKYYCNIDLKDCRNADVYLIENDKMLSGSLNYQVNFNNLPYTFEFLVYHKNYTVIPVSVIFNNIKQTMVAYQNDINAVVKYKVTLTENDIKIKTY